jgi:hypothetical protein
VREVRRYSNETVQLAAKRLRRAARHLTSRLPPYDRLFVLARQAQQQGLQPHDFVGATGEDALVAIAQATPVPPSVAVDTETVHSGAFVVDSLTDEYKTAAKLPLIKLAPFAQLTRLTQKAVRATLSPTWQRVLDHALRMPG